MQEEAERKALIELQAAQTRQMHVGEFLVRKVFEGHSLSLSKDSLSVTQNFVEQSLPFARQEVFMLAEFHRVLSVCNQTPRCYHRHLRLSVHLFHERPKYRVSRVFIKLDADFGPKLVWKVIELT